MTTKKLRKKLALSGQDMEEIKQAVARQEARTSGEISLAVIAESSCYAYWELLVAMGTSLLFIVALFFMNSQIESCLQVLFWQPKPVYLAVFYILAEMVLIFVLYLFYNIPAVDRLVVPEGAKMACVSARAFRHFTESGVYCTDNHSGILIFVSYFERQVRIVADRGISEKISQDLWNLVADEVSESLARGNAKDAFLNAVNRCGDLLAENFPINSAEEKKNQLSDGLIILENEAWV